MPAPSTATTGSAASLDGARPAGLERGVDAAGEGLDEHGPLVGHVVGEAVELGVVGDQLGGPAAAGRAAEAGLDPRLEVARRQVGVVVAVAGGGALERRREAAGLVAEHRFEHDAGAVVELADDLVAGDEREADPVVEVGRGVALDHRQVRPADAGQPGAHAVPLRARAAPAGRRWCTRAARCAPPPTAPAPTPPAPARAATRSAEPAAPSCSGLAALGLPSRPAAGPTSSR